MAAFLFRHPRPTFQKRPAFMPIAELPATEDLVSPSQPTPTATVPPAPTSTVSRSLTGTSKFPLWTLTRSEDSAWSHTD